MGQQAWIQWDFSFSTVKEREAFWILVLLWVDSLRPLVGIGQLSLFCINCTELKHIWEMREFGSLLHGTFLYSCNLNITFLTMIVSLYSHLQSTYLFL